MVHALTNMKTANLYIPARRIIGAIIPIISFSNRQFSIYFA
jgi:hypothetical protein